MASLNTQRTAPAGSARSGEQVSLYVAIYALFELAGFLWCAFQQLITTHDGIVGLLEGGIFVPSNITAQQLLLIINSNMDKYNKIAWTIAFITQIVYMGVMISGGPSTNKWLHRVIVGGFFLLEVTTDLWYSSATGTTIGGAFVWVFNWGNGGWIVSLSYIAAMSAGSMFLGWRAVNKLQRIASVVFRPQ